MSWTITESFTWYFYVYSLCTIYCDIWSCNVFGFLSGICKATKICSFFLPITHTVMFSDMILLICVLFSFALCFGLLEDPEVKVVCELHSFLYYGAFGIS